MTMKTKQEQIDKIQEIINDCYVVDSYIAAEGSEGGYIDTEKAAKAIVEVGYGDVSEYKSEIERLKDEIIYLELKVAIRDNALKDRDRAIEMLEGKQDTIVNQAKIDVLNKVKNYIDDKIENDYGDMSDSVEYLTINIDEFDDFIDELIEEIEKQ